MKSRIKFITLFAAVILCALATLAFVGCNGKSEFAISKSELSVSVGSSATLTATMQGENVAAEWSIDDAEIAKITVIGKLCTVKGLKEGTATITATSGENTATCTLTVTPDTTEVVTIKSGDTEVTELTLEMGSGKSLTAATLFNSPITWSSSNNYVATVENGEVTALRPGTTVITAQATASSKAEVTVTVVAAEGHEAYSLVYATGYGAAVDDIEGSENAEADKYFYWSSKFAWGQQEVSVDYANYIDGVVSFKYTCDTSDGYSYGFQLHYKNSKHELGKIYKLSCNINAAEACRVTLNGTVLDLVKGDNYVSVYYKYTSGLREGDEYGISSFYLVMGVADGSNSNKGTFVQNAEISISDIAWEDDSESSEQLKAPSFTLDEKIDNADGTQVIHITDEVNEEGVGGYKLVFYKDDKEAGSVVVEDGKPVDTSSFEPATYTVRLVAVAENLHYVDSQPSEDSATIVVTVAAAYSLAFKTESEAVTDAGRWAMWYESWVTASGTYKDGKVTVTFGNNAGVVHAVQVFYNNPSLVQGQLYKLVLNIDSPKNGAITINDEVVDLKAGENANVVVYYVEGTSASISIKLCDKNASMGQGVDSTIGGSGEISFEVVSVTHHQAVQLVAPSFTLDDDNVIDITDENASGTCTYEIGFFSSTESTTFVSTVAVENGDTVDPNVVASGEYIVRLRAVAANLAYKTSAWSEAYATVTSTSEYATIGNYENGGRAYAVANKGVWVEWHSKETAWTGGVVTLEKCTIDTQKTIAVKYSATGGGYNSMQLLYKNPDLETGKAYNLQFVIKSSVAGSVTVNGVVIDLQVGSNNATVPYIESDLSFEMFFGTEKPASLIKECEIEISNIVWNEVEKVTLTAPSFTIDNDNVISVTDPNTDGVGSYTLGFFANENDATAAYTLTVADGDTLNVSTMENATYTVKLKAVAADIRYSDSAWSQGVAFTVENDGVVYDLDMVVSANGENNTPNTWCGWAGLWDWTGGSSNATVTKAEYNNGTVTVTFKLEGGAGGNTWGLQIKYYKSDYVADTTYSFDIASTANVTIQAYDGAEAVTIIGGADAVTVTGKKSANFYMQVNVGANEVVEATITISNVVWA